MLAPSWVGTRVKYVVYYDMDEEGNERKLRIAGLSVRNTHTKN